MSLLTVELLKRKPPRVPKIRRWKARFRVIANRLVAAYGLPRLGNFRNPTQEIFYILLSARTTDAQYRKTHRALMTRFPTLADLAVAKVKDVFPCISGGGLAKKRANQVRQTAAILLKEFGPKLSRALRAMSPHEAFRFLTTLPGMGPKSALCVMMCSLDADVFPVDVNVQRVATRLGAIASGLKHYEAQQHLPGLIPEGRSKELHVGMVALGRTICPPRAPRCGACVLNDLCPTAKRIRLARP